MNWRIIRFVRISLLARLPLITPRPAAMRSLAPFTSSCSCQFMVAREAAILWSHALPTLSSSGRSQFMIARKTALMMRYAFTALASNCALLFRIHRSKATIRLFRLVHHDCLPVKRHISTTSATPCSSFILCALASTWPVSGFTAQTIRVTEAALGFVSSRTEEMRKSGYRVQSDELSSRSPGAGWRQRK